MKTALKKIAGLLGFEIIRKGSVPSDLTRLRSDFSPEEHQFLQSLETYTQTSPERLLALIRAVEYAVKIKIPGAFVECGVWKGGSIMVVAYTLSQLGVRERDLFLYDTFEGMTEPTEIDVSHYGVAAAESYRRYREEKVDDAGLFEINIAPLEEVRKALEKTGYPQKHVHFVKGKVENTIPGTAPEQIALLRLDTDWYESTRYEMAHLFPRFSTGGVLIVDDYGEWRGSRQAIDEYINDNNIPLLMNRIDYTCRIAVKP